MSHCVVGDDVRVVIEANPHEGLRPGVYEGVVIDAYRLGEIESDGQRYAGWAYSIKQLDGSIIDTPSFPDFDQPIQRKDSHG